MNNKEYNPCEEISNLHYKYLELEKDFITLNIETRTKIKSLERENTIYKFVIIGYIWLYILGYIKY